MEPVLTDELVMFGSCLFRFYRASGGSLTAGVISANFLRASTSL